MEDKQEKRHERISEMTSGEQRDFARRKMMAFVCKTCDMADSATPAQLDALPKVADVLLSYF